MPTKVPYEYYSTVALETELRDVKNMLYLVNNMQKPDNFTYIDVKNLINYLTILKESIEIQLKERKEEVQA